MNIISPIDCNTGYGITGYNICKNIYNIDNNICVFPIGAANGEKDWDRQMLTNSIIKNKINFDHTKPSLKVWHDHDFFIKPYGQSKYGGLSFFELDKISEISKKGYKLLDIIFSPSKWAKQILINNGVEESKIVVSPQGVDTNIFDNHVPQDKNETFIFINIGKWEIRKGHDILPELFDNAFSENDNVELWMINYNPFLSETQVNEWLKLYQSAKLSSKIRIFPRIPTQKELSKVMSYADCGIFPSRGEGWNNEAIELMAKNKPIIITNYSAHTEYCDNNNAYLIDIKNTVPAYDGIWFNGEGNWADFDNNAIEQTVSHMRYIYNNKIKTNSAGLATAQKYSWSNTAKIIYDNMYGVS